MGDEVPDDVRALLSQYIDSYEQLEILLLLRHERSEWTAQNLSLRLKISLPLAESALSALRSQRLVQTTPGLRAPNYTLTSQVPSFCWAMVPS